VRAEIESGRRCRIALVGRTTADVRDVMVEGESGILAVSAPWCKPKYEPSRRRLTWPNGAIATCFSADEPDLLRGPQHDGAWGDELAAWRYGADTWDQLQFGLRLGDDPRAVLTTTPRPTKLVREILEDPTTVTIRGSTYENAGNLAPAFLERMTAKYAGTRLGRQELAAELLDDNPFALWQRKLIEGLRVTQKKLPAMKRIVVAIDPNASSDEEAAEAGIIGAGLGVDGRGYVLEDVTTSGSPATWADAAVKLYRRLEADRIIAEANNGGEMVEHTVRTVDENVSFRAVHASRGKLTRAEPISALYEQGRVHHVGCFPELEDQMCEWVPGQPSPDRMDALVWALTELMLGGVREAERAEGIW
jgi:phage terminase large subunit-like protein